MLCFNSLGHMNRADLQPRLRLVKVQSHEAAPPREAAMAESSSSCSVPRLSLGRKKLFAKTSSCLSKPASSEAPGELFHRPRGGS